MCNACYVTNGHGNRRKQASRPAISWAAEPVLLPLEMPGSGENPLLARVLAPTVLQQFDECRGIGKKAAAMTVNNPQRSDKVLCGERHRRERFRLEFVLQGGPRQNGHA